MMCCLVHEEWAVNRKMGRYAKEVKELAMEMWSSCMYSSTRADYEVMWAGYECRSATTFGDSDTNRIDSISRYVKEAVHRRTRTHLSLRKVQRFAENEVVDSIYLYRQQIVQKLQWRALEQLFRAIYIYASHVGRGVLET